MSLVNEDGTPRDKVLVAVPCGSQVDAGFAQDLALMLAYTTFVRPELEVGLYFLKGTYLPRARATLVKKAIERCDTHILWLDADMRFPKDTLLRLLDHRKFIVGANYPTRQPPILPIAVTHDREPIFTHGDGLTEVRSCPMGVMLTRVDVFLSMKRPYFAIGYSREADDYAAEDSYFCEMARRDGFAVYVDGPLSEQVRHGGAFEFTMDHARMTRDAALAQQGTP